MIPVLIAIGVVIAGLAVTSTYVVLVTHTKRKNSEDKDFRCPECGASVDGMIELCPECGAEFKVGEFECPVCGSSVPPEAKMCMVCSERFEEEELFECPHCGSPVNPDSIICEKCDEEFWSPVKPAEPTEVEALVDMEESPELEEEMASS